MSERVTIVEMAPRDGLQNEKKVIDTADKIRPVDLLSATGLEKIEVASFVSPKWVPQMADGAQVLAGIERGPVMYAALTPNLKGYQRAREADVDEVAVFASASEGFSHANINCSIDESIERFRPVIEAAKRDHMPVRGYVSCVVECPYDGATDPSSVASVTEQLLALGCCEVSLGDTIGAGTPDTIAGMLQAVLQVATPHRLAGHYHDTNNRALDNISTSLELGVRVFDSSAAGLGGCPYAPGAKGNVATEDVVQHVEAAGYVTGIDQSKLANAAAFASNLRVD